MRIRMLAAALALGLCAPAWADTPEPELLGDWVGVESEAMPFPLVIHVTDEIRLDSPDRGVFGMLGDVQQTGRHVNIVFANGAAFEGDVAGDRMAGAYYRGGAELPLVFERRHAAAGGGHR